MIYSVDISDLAFKQLRRAPKHIVAKLTAWIEAVERNGLEEVRKLPGFNDHPLKGQLKDKRAIRLSRQWRAVYVLRATAIVEFILIEEVHPHDY